MALGILIGLPALYASRGNYSGGDILLSAVANLCFLPFLSNNTLAGSPVTGLIFPGDDPLWSIFFEMVASIAFIWLVRWRSWQMWIITTASFVLIFVGAALRAHTEHRGGLDVGAGFDTATFLAGFPRVAFGFIFGMLIYGRYAQRHAPRSIHAGWLYLALFAMLAMPSHLHNIYIPLAIGIVSPALVYYGSNANLGPTLVRVSEFLGWLSYPVYCLHRPVFNELSLLAGKGQAILHIPVGFVALAATLVLAVVASMALDHAGLQRKITMLLSTKSARPTMAAGN